jgi:hypothetical protein
VDGATTPDHTTSDHIKKNKEVTEGVEAGTTIAPLYFSVVELINDKSPALRLKKISPFARR